MSIACRIKAISGHTQIAIILLTMILSGYTPALRVVWLDELDLSNVDQSAGKAMANQSMWRTPLSIASEQYDRGVGTHAESVFRIQLDGKTISFKAKAGLDDSAPEHELKQASAEFMVIGDGKVLWRSGIMHAREKAKQVNVATKGIRSLILYVDHTGDGIVGDRADWVDASFEVAGTTPVSVKRTAEKVYITTPLPLKQPVINPPYVYGAHAGNPFLFSVPVSGERPVTITAAGLPEGLQIDQRTGIISGKAVKKGVYTVGISAQNQYGIDTAKLQLVIGDRLALTPPMGWNSWNVFGADVDDRKIRDMADAMVDLGLVNYGYAYINIDDGWQGLRGGKYYAIMPNEKFPDMKALVDYVHSKGIKIGIYSSPWVQTYAGFIGGGADTREGKVVNSSRRYGEFSFVKNDVQQWTEWGFDYLKYDWVTNDIAHTAEMTYLLDQSGRDVVFSISNAAPFELAADWGNLTNAWRTTGDIHDSWCSMTTIGFMQNKWQPYARPGSWNDPDMLVVGKVGWGKDIHLTKLSADEQYTHVALWSILAAPLLIGCDLNQIDSFTLRLITNKEVIAVDQDPAGIQGKRIFSDRDKKIEVWARPLQDGSLAVGLFNLADNKQEITVSWEQLAIKGPQQVRDLWRQQDKGVVESHYSSVVPSHGVMFLKIKPAN
ncbi:NPCBM/NEW2 domain-containing protein [Chitinophaga sp. Cy-1792]|uniref:NPCBM/NEW2 domain-containing protein n=1 Tax=Chitinophaga sp. Cy-1792 TaxID=2608339 RepID=UPI00141F0B32|nr:NPCBM/NEW2 domain-containing protein [Chitinophaga sp. Cy-1792]NIG56822.1 alpha-galactosidase [Chitinophaga sp. Cy-1792]